VVSPRVSQRVHSLSDLTRELSRKNVTLYCGARRSATREVAEALLRHESEATPNRWSLVNDRWLMVDGNAVDHQPSTINHRPSTINPPSPRTGRFIEVADLPPSREAVKGDRKSVV